MDLGDFETTIKVIIVGNGGVGKSSMAARYCKGVFTSSYKKTIGVDFLEKSLELGNGDTLKLLCWDTAGQEEFDALTSSYYRGAACCILVFSTTDRASFEALSSWKRKVEEECGAIPTVLVQNKVDLLDRAAVTPDEAEEAARTLGLRLYRVCVKEDLNVAAVFEYIAARAILGDSPPAATATPAVPLASSSSAIGTSGSSSSSSNSGSARTGSSGGQTAVPLAGGIAGTPTASITAMQAGAISPANQRTSESAASGTGAFKLTEAKAAQPRNKRRGMFNSC